MKSLRYLLWLAVAASGVGTSGCGGGTGSTEVPTSVTPPPSSGSSGWTVRVAWEASQASGVYGYHLYAGRSPSGLASASGLLTDTNIDVSIEAAGTYYFAVAAVDVNNVESSPSAPVGIELR